MRGRPSRGCTRQQFEMRRDTCCNAITTVAKDSMYLGVKMKGKPVGFLTPDAIEKLSLPDRAEYIEEHPNENETVEDYLYTASDGEQYGIFKLSPRECLRLMDVTDTDIDKMMAVNSNSRCYMQAGNSIVVNVLVAIFGQLFEGKEDTYKEAWKWILNLR